MNGDDKLKTFYENKCNIMEKKIEISRKNSLTKNKSIKTTSRSSSKSKTKPTNSNNDSSNPKNILSNQTITINQAEPTLLKYHDYDTIFTLSKKKLQSKSLTPIKYSFKSTLNFNKNQSLLIRTMTNIHKQSNNIVKDKDYCLYLNNVFIQRRALMKKKDLNKEEKNQKKFNSFYEHNMTFLNEKKIKINALKLTIETIENKECTFKPVLSHSKSHTIISKTAQNISPRHIYIKNQDWLNKLSKTITVEREAIENERMKDCTFHPNKLSQTTTSKGNLRIKLKYDKKNMHFANDYIYLKNLDWLKKIKLKLKQAREYDLKTHQMKLTQSKEQNINLIKLAESNNFLTSQEHLNLLAKPKRLNKAHSSYNLFKHTHTSSKGYQVVVEPNIKPIQKLICVLKQSVKENKEMMILLHHKFNHLPSST